MNNLKNMQYGSEIITYLNNIKSEIELYNGFKLYNINKFAEYFYSEFLNLLFGYELEIMEKVNPNMVAIDLGDKNGEIAIQITSDISRGKVQETVEKYNKNGLNKIYKRLVVLHISNETPNYNKPHEIEEFNLKEDVWNIEYFLSNMPIENIDKLKNIRDFLKKYVEDSPQISNLDVFLKERYKNQNFTKLKPLSSLNKDVYIKDIYQDLSIIKKREKEDKKDEEIIIDRVLDNSKKVAILGKAGIGKSTLSKYICYQWANGQLFDDYEYLFYIPIRKWEKGEGIFDVVLKVLKESNNENIKIEADDLYEYIKNFNNATLFVIDGFDEIRNEDQEDIKKEIQNLNNYIITSRHDGLKNNELNIEETFENEGFNQGSIEKFIGHIENSHELITHINENNQLKELIKIPMLLDMICYLYKENQIDFNNDFTMTSLYEKFLRYIIRRFQKERGREYNSIPKEINEIFIELGKVAFEKLETKDFQFKGETFIDFSNSKLIEKELLPFGILVSVSNEEYIEDREYEFIHTSFQEYFSALYVVGLSKEEQSEKIQESKFHPHMQMFFAFLGGLIGDIKDKEFLLREIESEPRDLIGVYEFILTAHCVSEIQKEDLLDERIDSINKHIINKFKNYPQYLLDNLFKVSHIINSDSVRYFINHFKEIGAQIEDLNKHRIIIDNLANAIKDDSKLTKEFVELLKNEEIDSHIREIISSIFLGFDEIDLEIRKLLEEIVFDPFYRENYYFIQIKLIEALMLIKEPDEKFLDDMIKIVKEGDEGDIHLGIIDVFSKLKLSNRLTNQYIEQFFKIFKNENIDEITRKYIAHSGLLDEKIDIEKESWQYNEQDEIDKLIPFPYCYYNPYPIFGYLDNSIKQEDSYISSIIEAYQENKVFKYFSLEIKGGDALLKHLWLKVEQKENPLYIRDNILYVMDRGEEIKVKENMTLDEIEIILNEGDLND